MYADAFFHEEPLWSRRPERRLALSFLPATLIIAGALMVLRLPAIEQTRPLVELLVHILANEVEQEIPDEPAAATPVSDASPAADPVTSESRRPTDWYAQIPEAARAANDSRPRVYSVNPAFDEKRRQAAEQFRRSRAPVKRPIWENVEKDTLGRTLLVSGNCHRVLDDPNVGNRDAFLVFGQFMTLCYFTPRNPQLLPWVSELQNRRAGQVRYGHPAAESP